MSHRLLLMQCHKKIQEGYVSTMTSNSDPSPFVVSANSNHPDCPPWKAFDGDQATSWHSATGSSSPWWLKIDLGLSVSIWKYNLTSRDHSYGGYPLIDAPVNWLIQGSNDNTNWIDIDTQTGIYDWTWKESRDFVLTKPSGKYRYYRFYCTLFGRSIYGGAFANCAMLDVCNLGTFQIYQYK